MRNSAVNPRANEIPTYVKARLYLNARAAPVLRSEPEEATAIGVFFH
jgi:hypothetical protein